MCTVLLPLGVNPIAVNKYIISYHIKGTERQDVWDQKKYVFKTPVLCQNVVSCKFLRNASMEFICISLFQIYQKRGSLQQ